MRLTRREFIKEIAATICVTVLNPILEPEAPRAIDEMPNGDLEIIVDESVIGYYTDIDIKEYAGHLNAYVAIDMIKVWRDGVRLVDASKWNGARMTRVKPG